MSGTCTAPSPPCRRPAADPTGIDYLGMVAAAHDEQAGAGIDFTQLPGGDGQENGDG